MGTISAESLGTLVRNRWAPSAGMTGHVRPESVGTLVRNTQLFKQFVDNESFRRWMADTVFGLTYSEVRVR